MIAPFPPTPCQVVRCEWSDGYVSEYVVDSPRTSSEYVSSVYDAIAVPRAQWEAVLNMWSALRDYERSLGQGDTPEHDDIAKRFYDACDHFATFFPEAP